MNGSREQWLLWCNLNDESKALAAAIPGAVEVTGSDTDHHKESTPLRFIDGDIRVLVSKPSIFGYGMNFQCCNNAAFVGLSESWEQVYQSTRRIWRFGQNKTVHTHFMDINPSDTLQRESAREDNDERHICPLQLQVIERGVELWSNPGDVVLSPFAGIGSEGYVSVKNKRKFIGIELKESYFKQACLNLKRAEVKSEQETLWSDQDAKAQPV